jgi:hypothetical protein
MLSLPLIEKWASELYQQGNAFGMVARRELSLSVAQRADQLVHIIGAKSHDLVIDGLNFDAIARSDEIHPSVSAGAIIPQ